MHTGLSGKASTSHALHIARNVLSLESLAGLDEWDNISLSNCSNALFLWFGWAAASASVSDALPLFENKVGWSRRPDTTKWGVGVNAAKMCSNSACLTPRANTSADLVTRSLGPVTSSCRNTAAWCPVPVFARAAHRAPRPDEASIMETLRVYQNHDGQSTVDMSINACKRTWPLFKINLSTYKHPANMRALSPTSVHREIGGWQDRRKTGRKKSKQERTQLNFRPHRLTLATFCLFIVRGTRPFSPEPYLGIAQFPTHLLPKFTRVVWVSPKDLLERIKDRNLRDRLEWCECHLSLLPLHRWWTSPRSSHRQLS